MCQCFIQLLGSLAPSKALYPLTTPPLASQAGGSCACRYRDGRAGSPPGFQVRSGGARRSGRRAASPTSGAPRGGTGEGHGRGLHVAGLSPGAERRCRAHPKRGPVPFGPASCQGSAVLGQPRAASRRAQARARDVVGLPGVLLGAAGSRRVGTAPAGGSPPRCGASAAGSDCGVSWRACVFIEHTAPRCFCCKASVFQTKGLSGASRNALLRTAAPL